MENNSCIIYTDYLEPALNEALYAHAIEQKEIFGHTQVAGKDGEGIINPNWRHSVSLAPKYFKEFYKSLAQKVKEESASIAAQLKLEPFDFGHIEMHLTSHNHGEFYKPHTDAGGKLKGRVITFVYYFHSIPKQFDGGQLLFLHNKPKPLIVEPANNSIVFFDSRLMHAVHPVNCPSHKFEDGRFTLNGWIWKKAEETVAVTGD